MKINITMKETELVQTFRELMSWDFFLDDHTINKLNMKNVSLVEDYTVPMNFFWREVNIGDWYENEIFKPTRDIYIQPERIIKPVAQWRPHGQGNTGPLVEQWWRVNDPFFCSKLRPHDYFEPIHDIDFWRYQNDGERQQKYTMAKTTQILKKKNTKYEPENKELLARTYITEK